MAPKPKTKSTGKGLKKKLGPFPVYVYLLGVAAIVGFIIYRKRKGESLPIGGSENQQVIPIAIPSGGQSGRGVVTGTSSTDGGTDTTPTPVDFPTDYVSSTDFNSAINDLGDKIGASVAQITFPAPNINITTPPATVINQTTKSKTAAKKSAPSAPKKFYTYKKNVPLKPGQKIHFTKGKGYYAGD